jgi:hypothetical protein
MRVAALYDIHANAPALEAVLAEVERAGVDRIVIGGDVVPGPLPAETIERLRALGDRAVFVRGNGDRWVVDAFDAPGSMSDGDEHPGRPWAAWTAEAIDRRDRDLLASFAERAVLDVDAWTRDRALRPTAGSPRRTLSCAPGSAHDPFHRLVDRAALLHLPLHAPGIDPVEELVRKRGDLLGNVIVAQDLDAKASLLVRLQLGTDELVGCHRVRYFNRHVANAAQIVRLPAVDGLVALGVLVGEQLQIDAHFGVLQEADVQADPAVLKSGIAGERGQIHTRVIHGTVGVGCLLEAEHGAVELGGDLDVVHDNVDVRDGLDISSRAEIAHLLLSTRVRRLDGPQAGAEADCRADR